MTPTGTPSSGYDANVTPPPCPASTSGSWLVDGDVKLPTLEQAVTRSSTGTKSTGSITGSSSSSGKGSSSPSISTSASGNSTGQGVLGGSSGSGLSTGAKAGIAVGIVLAVLIAAVIAFLIWRRQRNSTNKPATALDLSPEGKEVGSPPPKAEVIQKLELDSTSEQEMHANPSGEHFSTVIPVELGSSPLSESHQSGSVLTPSELSTIPPTRELSSASPSKLSQPRFHDVPCLIARHQLPGPMHPGKMRAFLQQMGNKKQKQLLLSPRMRETTNCGGQKMKSE